jgi:hypothetical protein
MNKKAETSAAAYNERFGASGGVTPQKELCENESLQPAGTIVSPPFAKPPDVVCHADRV